MTDNNFIYAAAIPEWFFNKEVMIRTSDILCIDGRFDKEAIMRFLESKNLHKEVEAFVRTPMIQKWTVTFKDKQGLRQFAKYSPFECEGSQYTVTPYEISEYMLRVHRLPPRVTDTRVVQALKEHVDRVVKINREKITYKRGKPRVVRNVVVEMNWFQLCRLPHRLEIQSNEALINLRDREPLCLHCNHIGHIRRQCIFLREFNPFLIAVESPEHPNATIYVTRDSPLAKSIARGNAFGSRSPPKNGRPKGRPKRRSPPQTPPKTEKRSNTNGNQTTETPKPQREKVPNPFSVCPTYDIFKDPTSQDNESWDTNGLTTTVQKKSKLFNPFSIWPLFGAFLNIKKRHVIDLRWSLPRHFAASL